MKNLEVLVGFFVKEIFSSDDGYKILLFEINDSADEIVVVGYFNEVIFDTLYKIYGNYKVNVKYGEQFEVEHFELILPNSEESIISFFSSEIFPYIGEKKAQQLYEKFGDEVINILKNNLSLIDSCTFLSDKQKESLHNGINKSLDETTLFFTQMGLNKKQIARIVKKYNKNAVEIVKENPYRLVFDIDGIGFKTADKFASILDEDYSDERLKAFIYNNIMTLCMKSGSTSVDLDYLVTFCLKQYENSIEKESVLKQIDKLIFEKLLYLKENRVYHHSQYLSECGIVDFLCDFINFNDNLNIDVLDEIKSIEQRENIYYSDEQKKAIFDSINNNFSILIGGPGTGKTTVVKAILSIYKKKSGLKKIALCAPTGRAAKRLSDLSGVEATTIHSLLKWDIDNNKFNMNFNNPLDYDFIIIDEFSMVDNYLFYNLLQACKNVKKILLIGDIKQLPSVNPGNLLEDLVTLNKFNVTELKKIFRQKEGNGIIELANDIVLNNITNNFVYDNVKFFQIRDENIAMHVKKIYCDALNKGYTSDEIQILSPMYKGIAGINSINTEIQNVVNHNEDFISISNVKFKVGDKVIQLKNRPEDFIFNGDIGEIIEINNDENNQYIICDFNQNEVLYEKDEFSEIMLAYCTSIHKSQGSEYSIVILPIARHHNFMLYNKLIYTAVTRAKSSLVILGDFLTLKKSIAKTDVNERYTTLKQFFYEKDN